MSATTSAPAAAAHAADWENMWAAGIAPNQAFDMGRVHPYLARALAEGRVPTGRALVPGCGRGYDVGALSARDRFAIGMDMSPTGVAAAREYLEGAVEEGRATAGAFEVVCGDFFKEAPPPASIDFVYDYTFLCALPPSRRAEWAAQMAALVKPGGLLLTLQFPLGAYGTTHPAGAPLDYTKGPPFLLSKQLYLDLLPPAGFAFVEGEDIPRDMSEPRRAGVEAAAWWRRV
jgi:SAM-dependent methyltransferase